MIYIGSWRGEKVNLTSFALKQNSAWSKGKKQNTLNRCDTVENIYEVIPVCGVTLRKVLILIKNPVKRG